jgi:O-antigen/teichoic acid export membrane protein
VLKFLKTKTIQDAGAVTGGMALSTLLSAANVFLLARWLGPSGFGLYIASLAIAVIVTDSLELAISGSVVNFGAKNDERSQRLIKHGFILKLVLGLGLGILVAILSHPLALWLNPSLENPLYLVAVIIPLNFLMRFPRSVLQSQKRFWADSSLEVIISLGRLLATVGFYLGASLTVVTGLLAYLLGALAALIIGSALISWQFLRARVDRETRRHFFKFQKWLTVGFILAAVHGRIDTTILLKLAGASATGIYQAGFRFFMPVMQLSAALSLVFAPRFASFATAEEARTYLKKASKLTSLLSLGVLLLLPLAPFLVQLIFGSDYQTAVGPTRILTLGFVWFILAAPFSAYLVYSKKETKFFALINLIQLVLLVGLDLWLIPRLGAIGAAWAMTGVLTVVNALIVIRAFK